METWWSVGSLCGERQTLFVVLLCRNPAAEFFDRSAGETRDT
jgi:hypothetical protein